MSVFFVISTSEVIDQQRYDEYTRLARPIVERHGGEYLLQSDKLLASKDWQTKKIIIIKFASNQEAESQNFLPCRSCNPKRSKSGIPGDSRPAARKFSSYQ